MHISVSIKYIYINGYCFFTEHSCFIELSCGGCPLFQIKIKYGTVVKGRVELSCVYRIDGVELSGFRSGLSGRVMVRWGKILLDWVKLVRVGSGPD